MPPEAARERGRGMSDANIPALLEELREVEPLLWEKITYLDQGDRVIKFAYQVLDDFALDHLQGCIQRAIAGRIETGAFAGYMLLYDLMGCEATITMGKEHDYDDIEERADTPAAAILAAYIEAVRAMR